MSSCKWIVERRAGKGLVGLLMGLALATAGVNPAAAQDDTPPDQAPAQPIDAEAEAESESDAGAGVIDAQAQADEAADQAALEFELASAKRFEAELAALLLPDGQLDTTQGDDALTKLASLATRTGILANSAIHDEVRFVLLGYQARALAALVSLEPTERQQDPSRIEQLSEVAGQLNALDLPGAQANADYWALLAGMAKQATQSTSPAQRQALTELVLHRYIERYEADEHASEYLLDTRLSLAQLMDQRGAQREAEKQLDRIGTLPPSSPRDQDLKRLRDSVARLGTAIQFESISTQLSRWRSSDHLGKPVLIHIYADQVEPSVRMIDVISRSIVEGTISGIAVVSLRIGEPVPGSASPPWPTLPVQLEPKGVLDQLGVTALPTLAWLDQDGKLASIGTTAAVLNQLDTLNADEPGASSKREADPAESLDLDAEKPDNLDEPDTPGTQAPPTPPATEPFPADNPDDESTR